MQRVAVSGDAQRAATLARYRSAFVAMQVQVKAMSGVNDELTRELLHTTADRDQLERALVKVLDIIDDEGITDRTVLRAEVHGAVGALVARRVRAG